jgi:hypothetical protein
MCGVLPPARSAISRQWLSPHVPDVLPAVAVSLTCILKQVIDDVDDMPLDNEGEGEGEGEEGAGNAEAERDPQVRCMHAALVLCLLGADSNRAPTHPLSQFSF